MFFIKLEIENVRLLLNISADKGMSVERLVRLAIFRGLRSLAKADNQGEYPELSGHQTRKKPIEEIQTYIRAYWKQESDEEMGKALGYSRSSIYNFRLEMGLRRPIGRKIRHDCEKMDALIREHWETKDDWEIGRLLDSRPSGNTIRLRRFELGLLKVRGLKPRGSVRDAIVPEEFERMVLREGYTAVEYIKEKGLMCSRQRVHAVAHEMGLKHSLQDRAHEWILLRNARKSGNLNLANREWLAGKVRDMISFASLAAELGVSGQQLSFFVKEFEITHPLFRKRGVEVENLVCANPGCNKPFARLKKLTDRRRREHTGDKPVVFYCSAGCRTKVRFKT